MHIIFALTFIFEMLIFGCCKHVYLLEFNNCAHKFDKNENENLNKKKEFWKIKLLVILKLLHC